MLVAGGGDGVRYLIGSLAVLALVGLFYLTWKTRDFKTASYLYDMESPEAEAAYCLAVVERIREITRGQGERKLEGFIDEQITFWRPRATGAQMKGRVALARDSSKPQVNEGAHLHLAIQDCGLRAVAYYGVHFKSME